MRVEEFKFNISFMHLGVIMGNRLTIRTEFGIFTVALV
jgi:hypothetical protein